MAIKKYSKRGGSKKFMGKRKTQRGGEGPKLPKVSVSNTSPKSKSKFGLFTKLGFGVSSSKKDKLSLTTKNISEPVIGSYAHEPLSNKYLTMSNTEAMKASPTLKTKGIPSLQTTPSITLPKTGESTTDSSVNTTLPKTSITIPIPGETSTNSNSLPGKSKNTNQKIINSLHELTLNQTYKKAYTELVNKSIEQNINLNGYKTHTMIRTLKPVLNDVLRNYFEGKNTKSQNTKQEIIQTLKNKYSGINGKNIEDIVNKFF